MRASKIYHILILLIALSLAANGLAFRLLPENVPLHWNFAGEADRFGNGLELLLIPAIGGLAGGIFALIARQCGKKGSREGALAEKILLWSGILEVVLFGGMGLYFLWKAGTYTPGDTLTLPKVLLAILDAPGLWLGVLFVVLGNAMPKVRRNDVFGVRTSGSMSSDEAWRKSQRLGGASAVALGFAQVLSGCLLEWPGQIAFSLIAALVWAVACVAMSSRYAREEKK